MSLEEADRVFNGPFWDIFASVAPRLRVEIQFTDLSPITWRLHNELCLVNIVNEHCSFQFPIKWLHEPDRRKILTLMKKMIPILPIIDEVAPLPARKLLFEFGDNGYLPSVSYCSKNNYACLIYDYDFFASGGYSAFRVISQESNVSWDDRSQVVFWRGQSTGMRRRSAPGPAEPNDFTWLQRLWLCSVGRQTKYKDICDIGLSGIVQIDEEYIKNSIKTHHMLKGTVDKASFLKHKYIVDIDGNSNAWSGLFTALLTSSCVLKIASERNFRQWYYDMLIPFHNYIPISADFCDFDDAISWVLRNDKKAREIGGNGERLARSITMENAISVSARNLQQWLLQDVSYLDGLK
jgi:hypothetical protein